MNLFIKVKFGERAYFLRVFLSILNLRPKMGSYYGFGAK
ncbi:hypothetical protein LEP1GSC058_1985 [Leptospira fainei serovar Hurstbridge str. BUT 6]|uniref:Uncharacterized protein n=1 Tax=Leptospira fainei serovar Hurstbridge str. BUT 6 TaxID=1193011 RepID=S3V3L1_9LEPT|nr:hypothetical protein LEP1GSC058_1985 [Leptospira fainei serovar Hurstbridge str. BUT 6]